MFRAFVYFASDRSKTNTAHIWWRPSKKNTDRETTAAHAHTHQKFFSHIIMNIYEFINLLTVLCIKIEMLLFCVPVYSKLFDFPEHRKKNITFPAWNYISYACRMRKTMKSEKRFWPFSVISFVKVRAKTKRKTRIWREKEWGGEREREGNENEPKKDAWVDFCGRWHVHKMRTTFEIIISIKVHLYGYQSACVRVRMNVFAVFIYGYSRNALHPSEKKREPTSEWEREGRKKWCGCARTEANTQNRALTSNKYYE